MGADPCKVSILLEEWVQGSYRVECYAEAGCWRCRQCCRNLPQSFNLRIPSSLVIDPNHFFKHIVQPVQHQGCVLDAHS